MSQSTVFISYSHKDEHEKELLLSHLSVLKHAGLIDLWSDDQISVGSDWKTKITQAISQARVAILLISANFLNSEFISEVEVPALLRRRKHEGLIVFPVIARPCAWQKIDWLTEMQVRPKNGRPVWGSSDSDVDEKLAAIADEVASIVNSIPSRLKYSSLIFVSRNEFKCHEYCDLLRIPNLKLSKMLMEESQNMSLHYLVTEKINRIKEKLPGIPFFVEHTGLIIDAWKGLPGGLTSLFMDTIGNEGICKMMRGYGRHERGARAKVVIGFFHPDYLTETFEGEVVGSIAPEPRGNANFGWDPIFIPKGDSRTYGEMTLSEKNQTSMRRIASERFEAYLADHFEW